MEKRLKQVFVIYIYFRRKVLSNFQNTNHGKNENWNRFSIDKNHQRWTLSLLEDGDEEAAVGRSTPGRHPASI